MTPTSVSLLDRLKAAGPDAADWRRLHDLYRPLIRHWIGRALGLAADADDLTQDVLLIVVRELPRFDRRRDGSFRAWLRTVTVNRVRQHWRTRRRSATLSPDGTDLFLAQLEDPAGGLAAEWDRDHDRHVLQKLLALVEPDFAPATWAAFRRFALDGEVPATKVAAELGLSENAVLLAKARVLKRLREEAAGLID